MKRCVARSVPYLVVMSKILQTGPNQLQCPFEKHQTQDTYIVGTTAACPSPAAFDRQHDHATHLHRHLLVVQKTPEERLSDSAPGLLRDCANTKVCKGDGAGSFEDALKVPRDLAEKLYALLCLLPPDVGDGGDQGGAHER